MASGLFLLLFSVIFFMGDAVFLGFCQKGDFDARQAVIEMERNEQGLFVVKVYLKLNKLFFLCIKMQFSSELAKTNYISHVCFINLQIQLQYHFFFLRCKTALQIR